MKNILLRYKLRSRTDVANKDDNKGDDTDEDGDMSMIFMTDTT